MAIAGATVKPTHHWAWAVWLGLSFATAWWRRRRLIYLCSGALVAGLTLGQYDRLPRPPPSANRFRVTQLDIAEPLFRQAPWANTAATGVRAVALLHPTNEMTWIYAPELGAPGDSFLVEGVRRAWPQADVEGDTLSESHLVASLIQAATIEPASVDELSLEPQIRAFLAHKRYELGQKLRASIDNKDVAAIAAAVIVGDRSGLSSQIYRTLSTAGIVHVLSVSGFHITCVAFLARLVMLVGLWPLVMWKAFDARRVSAIAALLLVVGYTALSGAEVPAVRSAVMWSMPLLAIAVGRSSLSFLAFYSLWMAFIICSPRQAASPAAAFSFFSVLVLLHLSRCEGHAWQKALWTALVAAMSAIPLSAYFFTQAAWAAAIFNLLSAPFATLLVGSGAVWLTVGELLPSLPLIEASTSVLLFIARLAPPAVNPAFSMSAAEASLGLLVVIALANPSARACRRPLGVALLVLMMVPFVRRAVAHEVHFLPVGQGDSTVVFTPPFHVTVVDTGGDYDGRTDPGARVVVPFLLRHRVSVIDDLVITHPHPDHVGGASSVFSKLSVRRLWTNGQPSQHPAQQALLRHSAPRPACELGQVIHPCANETSEFFPELSMNDNSVVMSLGPVLLTGDVEELGESEIEWQAHDVVKIPHHGSHTSTSELFLQQVKPKVCVIQVGQGNKFGHPSMEVVRRLQHAHCQIYRTDEDGLVSVRLPSPFFSGLAVRAFRRGNAWVQVE